MEKQVLHGKAKTLKSALRKHKVPVGVINQIMEGADAFEKYDYVALRHWFGEAMKRMDALLDDDTKQSVREACACCKTGKRHEIAKRIFDENDTVEKRFEAFSREPYIIGHRAEQLPDGSYRISFSENADSMKCPCLRMLDEPLSETFCMCCGGHIKYHLETALGITTKCSVVSSLQSSCGTKPCIFEYVCVDAMG